MTRLQIRYPRSAFILATRCKMGFPVLRVIFAQFLSTQKFAFPIFPMKLHYSSSFAVRFLAAATISVGALAISGVAFAQTPMSGSTSAVSSTSASLTTEPVAVFAPMRGNPFKAIRIPAIVITNRGTLLAFAEGRGGGGDQSQNALIVSRSEDGGKTWSAAQTIWRDGNNSINNPTAVVDRATGEIFVIVQRYPAGLSEFNKKLVAGIVGQNILRNFIFKSSNDGVTWSAPLDVTATTKRPAGVKIMAGGPGVGIQLTRGQYKGRLIFPFNEGVGGNWNLVAVYSDDHGATWHLGQPTPHSAQIIPNENTVVELSDGSVMFNSRHWRGSATRKIAISANGGLTWGPLHDAKDLYDPACEGCILRYSFADRLRVGSKSIILYCGPAGPGRENGTVYLSEDDGKTWPHKKLLVPGGFSYSSMTLLANGRVGLLYEQGGEIKFIAFAVSEIEK